MKPARLPLVQVYDINPELVEDQGFVEILKARLSLSLRRGRLVLSCCRELLSPFAQDLLGDGNPMAHS